MYLKLRKYCNFGTKNSRRAWHIIPAQEVNEIHNGKLAPSEDFAARKKVFY